MNSNLSPATAALCPSRFAAQSAQFSIAVPLWMYDRMVDSFAQLVTGQLPTETTLELLPALREHRNAEVPDVWIEGRKLDGDERAAELVRVFGTVTPSPIEEEAVPGAELAL